MAETDANDDTERYSVPLELLQVALEQFKNELLTAMHEEIDTRLDDRDTKLTRLDITLTATFAKYCTTTQDKIANLRKKLDLQESYVSRMRNGLELTIKDHLAKLSTRVQILEAKAS